MVSQALLQLNAHILYPASAIMEAATKIQRVMTDATLAVSLMAIVYEDEESVVDVTRSTLKEAQTLFNPRGSKQHTIYDCVVATIAQTYDTTLIFSFDRWYKKLGFTLAEDYVSGLNDQ